jgi:hypothetical protein
VIVEPQRARRLVVAVLERRLRYNPAVTDYPNSAQLWKRLPEEKRLRAAEAFWNDEEAIEQHVEAMTLLARRLNARPKFIQSMPNEKKARHLANYPGMPDVLAARLLVAYHLTQQRDLLKGFLDAVGIPHEDGLITTDPEAPADAERLAAAARDLDERFAHEDVSIYFGTLLTQDPDTWAGLRELPQTKRLRGELS